jgi:hypothetical protein
LRSPHIVPISAFFAHAAAVLTMQVYAPRFILPLVPLLCFVAAYGFRKLSASIPASRVATASILMLVLTYQLYNAVGIELQYHNDIRNAVAVQLEKLTQEEQDAVTFSNYSYIRGSRRASGKEAGKSRIDSDFFVTCDLEYSRYLLFDDASEIYHAFGGQKRLNFYRDLFGGELSYRVAFEVENEPLTLEERLRARGLLTPLGEFIPRHCIIFGRTPEANPL